MERNVITIAQNTKGHFHNKRPIYRSDDMSVLVRCCLVYKNIYLFIYFTDVMQKRMLGIFYNYQLSSEVYCFSALISFWMIRFIVERWNILPLLHVFVTSVWWAHLQDHCKKNVYISHNINIRTSTQITQVQPNWTSNPKTEYRSCSINYTHSVQSQQSKP